MLLSINSVRLPPERQKSDKHRIFGLAVNGTPYTESDYAHDDYAINVRRMGWILTEYYYWLWLFRGTCGSTPCFQRPVLDEHTLTPVDFSGLTELVSSFHWLYKASTSTDVEVDDTSDAMIYIAFCGEI